MKYTVSKAEEDVVSKIENKIHKLDNKRYKLLDERTTIIEKVIKEEKLLEGHTWKVLPELNLEKGIIGTGIKLQMQYPTELEKENVEKWKRLFEMINYSDSQTCYFSNFNITSRNERIVVFCGSKENTIKFIKENNLLINTTDLEIMLVEANKYVRLLETMNITYKQE